MTRYKKATVQFLKKLLKIWKALSSKLKHVKPLITVKVKQVEWKKMRIKNPVKSVGLKMFIPVFLSIVLLISTLGFISYSRANSIIQDKVSASSEQTIFQVADKLELTLRNVEDGSLQLISDVDFTRLLSEYKNAAEGSYEKLTSSQEIIKKLNTMTTGKSSIRAIHVIPIAKGGKVISSAGSANGLTDDDFSKLDWFQNTIKAEGSVVWLPTLAKGYLNSSPEPTFSLGRLVKSLTSGRDFVLLFELRTKTVNEILSHVKMGDTGKTVVVTPDNKLVFSSDEKVVDTSFSAQINDKMITDSSNNSLSKKAKVDGANSLIVYKSMQTSGWTVMSAVKMSELTRETKQIYTLTLIIIVIGIFVAIGVGFTMARVIGGPLVTLRNLMKQGEQGDLTVRMNHSSKDEIGQLSASFNQMMEQITRLVVQTNDSAAKVLETARELLSASKQTATSAQEIAVATEEIANGSSGLAAEAEKGNTLTQDISMQMKQVVDANEQMGKAATHVQKASEQGTFYMAELTNKTNITGEMTRAMVGKVDKLKESTSSIRKILDVLNNMTTQTNVLSLNATIEAARAGAAGKGFMVVADEIRLLAEQSKQNIRVVGTITETIQKEIDQTISVLSNAYPVFKEQIESVKEAELIFKQVQSNMSGFIDQLSGVNESIQQLERSQHVLTDAMSNVSAVSEQSTAVTQQVASLSNEQLSISDGLVKLSESLEMLSNSLRESLSKFRV